MLNPRLKVKILFWCGNATFQEKYPHLYAGFTWKWKSTPHEVACLNELLQLYSDIAKMQIIPKSNISFICKLNDDGRYTTWKLREMIDEKSNAYKGAQNMLVKINPAEG
ncbi:hypothetical protein LXL04_002013 [Taraxacum kok-saghyz]